MKSIDELFTDHDWRSAIAVASERNFSDKCLVKNKVWPAIGLEHVTKVIAAVPGINDEASWLLIVKLGHPQKLLPDYAIIESGCDYTGWDCQSGGSWTFCWDDEDLDKMITYEQRDRLAAAFPEKLTLPLYHRI